MKNTKTVALKSMSVEVPVQAEYFAASTKNSEYISVICRLGAYLIVVSQTNDVVAFWLSTGTQDRVDVNSPVIVKYTTSQEELQSLVNAAEILLG